MKGKVWTFGDNVDTDQIIPAEYLVTSDMVELSKHVFEKVRPDLARYARKGDIIVAGKNFGCGSSREHASRAIIGLGISCIIAESFARIFFRNSINLGLPVIECKIEANELDTVEIKLQEGTVKNLSTSKTYNFPPYPPFIRSLLEKKGLIDYVKECI